LGHTIGKVFCKLGKKKLTKKHSLNIFFTLKLFFEQNHGKKTSPPGTRKLLPQIIFFAVRGRIQIADAKKTEFLIRPK
jgi:hypothetical protein